jgi:TadE-like protein
MPFAKTIREFFQRFSEPAGSQIAEFAVCVPLLTIFTVGIFDFSGAFNLKQKLASAAQEGAFVAATEPTYDLVANQYLPPPQSIQAIEQAIFLDLEDLHVIPLEGSNVYNCGGAWSPAVSNFTWTYTIHSCPLGTLTIIIDRGCTPSSSSPSPCLVNGAGQDVVYSHVTIQYPYSWRFQNVIQLVGGSSALPATLTVDAYAMNQS